jgi:drug/metabolite transporter (DMT)-like permease
VWSNSFIAIGYLLGRETAPMRFDWVGLTVARFVVAAAVCAAYCFGLRRAESFALLRAHWRRLLLCACFAVPGYNLALYYGQQHGVPAPVASLTTTLAPLFMMTLAAMFLGEPMTARRIAGFAVAATGMALVSLSRGSEGARAYPLVIAITALAPLSWSVFSVLSKPLAARASPVVWTYLVTAAGGVLVLPLLPGQPWRHWASLDPRGWLALLYLALPCTVFGFALWTWLLRQLPASSVGFTVFLNPPLTTLSKYVLSATLPASFAFQVAALEWVGGALALAGIAVALWRRTG